MTIAIIVALDTRTCNTNSAFWSVLKMVFLRITFCTVEYLYIESTGMAYLT